MKKLALISVAILLVPVAGALADTYNEEPEQDTWIYPGSGPYGSSTELRTNLVTAYDQEIVIQFDLDSLPESLTVNLAELGVYNYQQYSGSSLTGEIYRVTESWDEYTLVNSIDHDSANPYDSIELYGTYSWHIFDITDLVQEWVDEDYDNYGIVFYGVSGDGRYIRFYSREAGSDNPYLEIDYTDTTAVQPVSLGYIKALMND